jgi:hypothetical protein
VYVVHVRDADGPGFAYRVIVVDVEFEPGVGSNPSLKRHPASITINTLRGYVRDICLQGNRVLLRFADLVVIWDPEEMRYVCIEVTDPFSRMDVSCAMAIPLLNIQKWLI